MKEGPNDPPPMACAVCGYIVAKRTSAEGLSDWIHAGGTTDDHPVVAVPHDLVRANVRCDFCNRVANPTWTLPVKDFVFAPGHVNIGSWAICVDCLPFVEAGKWDDLVERQIEVRTEDGEDMSNFPREAFEWTYRLLKPNILGAPYLDDV